MPLSEGREPLKATSGQSHASRRAETEHQTILIIEDDAAARELIQVVLADAGFRCLGAGDGEEGLRLARSAPPAVAIVDVHLPGISGYEVCRGLREAHGLGLLIIFLSGERTESFDRVAGLLLGADDYLTKPFATDELVARVRCLLRRQPVGRASAFNLTVREAEILSLLAQGMQQDAIGNHLRIRAKTVGTHIEHLLMKLGVQSRTQAVALAYREGLVDRDGLAR